MFSKNGVKKPSGVDNVYNVSSATLTSYVSHGGDNMDTSLPSYVPRPQKQHKREQKAKKKPKDPEEKKKSVLQTVRNILVVLALSLHAVFEGMAVGKKTLLAALILLEELYNNLFFLVPKNPFDTNISKRTLVI